MLMRPGSRRFGLRCNSSCTRSAPLPSPAVQGEATGEGTQPGNLTLRGVGDLVRQALRVAAKVFARGRVILTRVDLFRWA